MDRLAGMGTGEFCLLAPDLAEDPVRLRVRHPVVAHRTLNEDEISALRTGPG